MRADLAGRYPKLDEVTSTIDGFLAAEHPEYFGPEPIHPFLSLRESKVIHDSLWGTNGFNWRELALIDSPIFQRLRCIHQTGLAYYVYPCAHHMRFEHSLGVCVMASRVFDALQRQAEKSLRTIAKELCPDKDPLIAFAQWRAELRLAALLHDTGHSLHSHTSEVIYSDIPLLKEAADELSNFVGLKKGAGEVLSFCISRTKAIWNLLERVRTKVKTDVDNDDEIDLDNISLMIVGRSKQPQLQFLGDIISSHLDADKLDYLLRDAVAAGLPLRYDLERYLYTVRLCKQRFADGDGLLRDMYTAFNISPERLVPDGYCTHPHYIGYQLRLPRQAANTIEQIMICKFMLFSYIYHHKKVRAAEGLLARLISHRVQKWRNEGKSDADLIQEFLRMTDHSLDGDTFELHELALDGYRSRIINRLLPRVVLGFTPRPEIAKLSAFLSELQKGEKREQLKRNFESVIAERLMAAHPELGTNEEEVLSRAGVWFDAPKPPTFDKLEDLFIGDDKGQIELLKVFPISTWIQAYIAYRYYVRVFAFSEFSQKVSAVLGDACKEVFGIDDPDFIAEITNTRG